MCGRFALHTGVSEIAAVLGIEAPVGDAAARYNVAPGSRIFLVIAPSEDNAVTFSSGTWGFRPASAGERVPRPINARAETVATSRYFSGAFAHRRALIPADGWYEWRLEEGGRKQPYYFSRRDGQPLMFAGLWEPTSSGTDRTCLIITQPAAQEFASIHHRMPVVLDPACWRDWLDAERTSREAIRTAARALGSGELQAFPVGGEVNRPTNNGPGLIEPLSAAGAGMAPWATS